MVVKYMDDGPDTSLWVRQHDVARLHLIGARIMRRRKKDTLSVVLDDWCADRGIGFVERDGQLVLSETQHGKGKR